MDYLSISWLALGYWLYIIPGIIWAAILIPVQIKQAKMAHQFQNGGAIPENYWTLGRVWIVFAHSGEAGSVVPAVARQVSPVSTCRFCSGCGNYGTSHTGQDSSFIPASFAARASRVAVDSQPRARLPAAMMQSE